MIIKSGDFEIECGTDVFSTEPYDLVVMRLHLSAKSFPQIAYQLGLAIARHELGICAEHAPEFARDYADQLTIAYALKVEVAQAMDAYEQWNTERD